MARRRRETLEEPEAEAAAYDVQRQQFILEKYAELPADGKASLLLRVFGDAALRQTLEAERERVLRQKGFADSVDVLKQDMRTHRRLDFRQAPAGTVLALSLYDRGDYGKAASLTALREEYLRARQLDMTVLGGGNVQILGETLGYDYQRPKPPLHAHQVVSLGSFVVHGTQSQFEPVVYLGSVIDAQLGEDVMRLTAMNGSRRMDLVLGDVSLNDESLVA